ncbi:hypothetical protein GCM10018793_00680 [Streptomyces sulfonofaciens]|uniref:Uncharacterized protein n=1 Tax=Streptomyces sulfonofaciens TaxID=68272 RepID=A0A919FMN5_9ACTN|nr:hypothetical protein GCM10018793_00680 [Streptomyces sulfonofaciens]
MLRQESTGRVDRAVVRGRLPVAVLLRRLLRRRTPVDHQGVHREPEAPGSRSRSDAAALSAIPLGMRCIASPDGRGSPQGSAKVLDTFERVSEAVTALFARLFASAAAREGMTAFLERRDPAWAR